MIQNIVIPTAKQLSDKADFREMREKSKKDEITPYFLYKVKQALDKESDSRFRVAVLSRYHSSQIELDYLHKLGYTAYNISSVELGTRTIIKW